MDKRLDNWCVLPTQMGEFRMYDADDENIHIVCFGDLYDQDSQPLLRVHSSCLASEVFGATDCDCADQLRESMKLIASEGRGIVVHLHQEGRRQGLSNKIKAVHIMQHNKYDTCEAFESLELEQDPRTYDPVIRLLKHLSISKVRLISNNPAKKTFILKHGVDVELVNTHPTIRPENIDYLETKKAKLGHLLCLNSDKQDNGPILFYHSDQPWGELSNFSQHAIYLRNRIWSSVEHFYQSQKFADTTNEDFIRLSSTTILAKQRAEKLSKYRRLDWQSVKEQVMLKGLRAKFDQHPELRNKLLSSGERVLIEHTAHDAYWGDKSDGTGLNKLGKLLMQIRTEIR